MSFAVVFPQEPFFPDRVDEAFHEQALIVQDMGHTVALMDFDAMGNPEAPFADVPTDVVPKVPAIYRGWMLDKEGYTRLYGYMRKHGYQMQTSPEEYIAAHHKGQWLKALGQWCAPTVSCAVEDAVKVFAESGFSEVIVKDEVKSLKDAQGVKIVKSTQQLHQWIAASTRHRGQIEGNTLYLSQKLDLVPQSETRFFGVRGKLYATNHDHDQRLYDLALQVLRVYKAHSPFFSIDVALDTQGKAWLMEIGDGQVSDLTPPWEDGHLMMIINGLIEQE